MCVNMKKCNDSSIIIKFVISVKRKSDQITVNGNWGSNLSTLAMMPHSRIIWMNWVLQIFLIGEEISFMVLT